MKGPLGLQRASLREDAKKRGKKGASEAPKNEIAKVKIANQDFGIRKISDFLKRFGGVSVSKNTVSKCKRIERKRIEVSRAQVKVNAREAVWALDGTNLGRANGKKIEAQVIRGRGTLILLPAQVGKPATGDILVASLKALRDKRGLPLVLSTDNGSNYVSSAMSDFLKKEKVIHLRSLPRNSQHNGSAENGIRELKEAISYRTETIVKASASAMLEMSAWSLNQSRLWASKDYKTSSHLDDTYPVAYLKVDRASFYERCMQRQLEARAKGKDARAVRMMEREEILRTLEEFELVTIKRGKAQNAKDEGEVIL